MSQGSAQPSRQLLTDSFVNYLHEPNPNNNFVQERSKSTLLLHHSRSTNLDVTSSRSRDHSGGKTQLSQTASQQKLINQPRLNIKSNTRHLKHEIHSIDEEIAELQDTIFA